MASSAKNIIVIGAVSVALAAAGVLPSYAFAAPNTRAAGTAIPGSRRFGFKYVGKVSSVDETSITLAGQEGATQVLDTRDATIIKAGALATVAEVAVGDPIAVIGPAQKESAHLRLEAGTTSAVSQAQDVIHHQNFTMGGTIVATAPSAISLLPKGHPGKPTRAIVEVGIGTQTTIMSAGQTVFPDVLTAGAQVVVSGTRDAQGAMIAEKVIVRP